MEPLDQCTVDAVTHSFIFISPCSSSVFIRDCSDCVFVVASHQVRLKNCERVTLVVSAQTPPVIEKSTDVVVCGYRWYYPELMDQFHAAGLYCLHNEVTLTDLGDYA
jgi:protein XRP2